MKFNNQQNLVWKTLFERQIPNINKFACKEFILGLEKLKINSASIPTIKELNRVITKQTDWKIVMTQVRYLNQKQWAEFMSKKEFPITNFIRVMEELDFTPEPDIFHDVFGHLPFLLIPEVLEIIEIFSELYSSASTENQINILSKLWWFSIEFGLIKEGNDVKAFGAGLMSSFSEIQKALSSKVKRKRFDILNVINETPAVYSTHNEFFVIDSIGDLKNQLLNLDLESFR